MKNKKTPAKEPRHRKSREELANKPSSLVPFAIGVGVVMSVGAVVGITKYSSGEVQEPLSFTTSETPPLIPTTIINPSEEGSQTEASGQEDLANQIATLQAQLTALEVLNAELQAEGSSQEATNTELTNLIATLQLELEQMTQNRVDLETVCVEQDERNARIILSKDAILQETEDILDSLRNCITTTLNCESIEDCRVIGPRCVTESFENR
jgi:hypothetical protein